jgi:hypothetical protein
VINIKEYRFPGDDFIFYGKDEVDSILLSIKVRMEIQDFALDEQYKTNIALCHEIDRLKAKKK